MLRWGDLWPGARRDRHDRLAPVARPSEGRPGKARRVEDYMLKPGIAYLYDEGDLHSPRRDGPTRLIRIEGKNMEKIQRYPYERVV